MNFDSAPISTDTAHIPARTASVTSNGHGEFPALFTDEEFEDLHRKRLEIERPEHDRMDNAGIRAKPAPTDGRPESTLEQRFAHVAKQLAGMWPSPACAMYIERLVISDRGSRQGFPQDVIDDLIMLFQINEIHCKTPAPLPGTGNYGTAGVSRANESAVSPAWTTVRKR